MSRIPNYAISVVIPAYNCASSIARTVDSVLDQTLERDRIQVVIVNDGSTDETLSVCLSLAADHENILVYDKENGGVGSTRNKGIDLSEGKYIAFLDADDTLDKETLKYAVDFFEEHYDEVDLVTYPMVIVEANKSYSHVREQILKKTGVYDLREEKNFFSLVTNVNVVVKNSSALPRFREDMVVHEDELFMMEVLLGKLSLGFSKHGAYRYTQRSDSATHLKMHPYYLFEDNIRFWEELFARFDEDSAPGYLQASFLNELSWKLRKDVLFPYHYQGEDEVTALSRITSLLERVDDHLIVNAPRMDEYLKLYFLKQKSNRELSCCLGKTGITVMRQGSYFFEELLSQPAARLQIIHTRLENHKLLLKGVVKSLAFEFSDKPDLYLTKKSNGDATEEELVVNLVESSHSRHLCHTKTNLFWFFSICVSLDNECTVGFRLLLNGHAIPVKIDFSDRSQFNWHNRILKVTDGASLVSFDYKKGVFRCKAKASNKEIRHALWANNKSVYKVNKRAFAARIFVRMKSKKQRSVWLYSDRPGKVFDNAYDLFLHDLNKDDGIDRFYISGSGITNYEGLAEAQVRKHVITFGSTEHKTLFANANKIIVSYIEPANWCPYSRKALNALADHLNYKLIYLQHGVLHAHVPWKYSADRLLPDYEVVSTGYEVESLTNNYVFQDSQLIRSGMPRYDRIDHSVKPKKKILYAPSWRKYLVSEQSNLEFGALPSAFENSILWQETRSLLGSVELMNLLNSNGYELHIKLHPIFSVYEPYYRQECDGERVKIVSNVRESDYEYLITDFSSLVFDYVYLGRKILYFFPDIMEFKAGLNAYRKLDIPLDEGFGPLASKADDLVEHLSAFIEGREDLAYQNRVDNFFLHYDNCQCDRLYKAIMEDEGLASE